MSRFDDSEMHLGGEVLDRIAVSNGKCQETNRREGRKSKNCVEIAREKGVIRAFEFEGNCQKEKGGSVIPLIRRNLSLTFTMDKEAAGERRRSVLGVYPCRARFSLSACLILSSSVLDLWSCEAVRRSRSPPRSEYRMPSATEPW